MAAARNRWLPLLLLAGGLAFQWVRHGFEIRSVLAFGVLFLILIFSEIFEPRIPRPWRSYLAAALGSASLALLLAGGGLTGTALIFWLAMTALALFWAWYWERTEPLPSAD